MQLPSVTVMHTFTVYLTECQQFCVWPCLLPSLASRPSLSGNVSWLVNGKLTQWVSGWVGFWRSHQHITGHFGWAFPVNHLHWYWQPNQNNQETEHKQTQNNATFKLALVNSTKHIQNNPRLRHRTERAWIRLWHLAGQQSGSILQPTVQLGPGQQSPHRATHTVALNSCWK